MIDKLTLRKRQFSYLFLATILFLMTLPFLFTSQDLITRILEVSGLGVLIQHYIIPIEVKFVIAILQILGVGAIGDNRLIVIQGSGREVFRAQVIWSCIGWQSALLLIVTLITGFKGSYTLGSRTETLAIGLLGTFWVNIFRIVLIYLIGFRFGQLPAYLFHNIAGTFITIVWLFFFWWFSYSYVLEDREAH